MYANFNPSGEIWGLVCMGLPKRTSRGISLTADLEHDALPNNKTMRNNTVNKPLNNLDDFIFYSPKKAFNS
jgi:hypothetical protein